jgi:hypothetical protein
MSQYIYQLFDNTFVDKDEDYTYIDPETFIWNGMNYWGIKEYYNALSIDSLSDIIDMYSNYVPYNCNRYSMINEFCLAIDTMMAYPISDKLWTQDDIDKLTNDAEASRAVNLHVLEEKFDEKVRHISSIKKLYDIKAGDKEVGVDDDEIGLQVEI